MGKKNNKVTHRLFIKCLQSIATPYCCVYHLLLESVGDMCGTVYQKQNRAVQLYLGKVLNTPNKGCSHILYKVLQSFAKTRYPSLLFRPIRLEICWVWACARDLEWKSLCVRERPLKGTEKKRLAEFQKCTEITHTHTHHFCHSQLSFPPSLSLCGLLIDKTTHILKPRDKQLIIYTIVATRIHFAARELYTHTQTYTQTHTQTLQETEWAIARNRWRWELVAPCCTATSLLTW